MLLYLFSKNEISATKNLIIDLNGLTNINYSSNFMVRYKEAWVEEGILFVKQEFCEYGDLLDFMETLEGNNFTFNAEFFWDIIFQMLSVNKLKTFINNKYKHKYNKKFKKILFIFFLGS